MATATTELVSLDPIAGYSEDIKTIITYSAGLTITSDKEAAHVTEVLSRIAKKRKQIKEARLAITRPLDEAKKAAIEQEKAVLDPLEPVDRKLRQGLEDWHAEQERKRREEQERIERERREQEEAARKAAEEAEREARRREYEAGRRKTDEARARQEDAAEEAHQAAELARLQGAVAGQSPAPQVPEQQALKGASGSASVAMVWTSDVTDETQVPREYLKVDQAAITQAVRDGVREIPGVEIKQVPRTSVRAS